MTNAKKMKEYIEKDAALNMVCCTCCFDPSFCDPKCADYLCIKEIPSADVVPVVRCEDCKYNSGAWRNGIWCVAHRKSMRRNDYCSRGVKKCGTDTRKEEAK